MSDIPARWIIETEHVANNFAAGDEQLKRDMIRSVLEKMAEYDGEIDSHYGCLLSGTIAKMAHDMFKLGDVGFRPWPPGKDELDALHGLIAENSGHLPNLVNALMEFDHV